MDIVTGVLFFITLFFNLRAVWKLLIDWRGMAITLKFIRRAYGRLAELPTEEALEGEARAPFFLHLVAAYQEPEIATTLRALLDSRYPHGKIRFVVITKEEEDRFPHPLMEVSTAELVRRFIADLPPYEQKLLHLLAMPGQGRKAHQLNCALREETLRALLGPDYDPGRVFVGVSDADSFPDPRVYRWIAGEELAGRGSLAYQGVTLALANYDRLNMRGRISAIQQSSIFIRVSIARLINEVKRVAWLQRLGSKTPGLYRLVRPLLEFCLRRSQICLGHNQFVRLDVLKEVGGFPTSGVTEDSTLGYLLGMRGDLIRALPMVELNDLPETKEKIIRQSARWYKGVLDDIGVLRRTWRANPTAYNLAQFCRHLGNKVVEWPVAAIVYPVMGFLGWHLAIFYQAKPWLFILSLAVPSLSLGLTIWVGGIVTQNTLHALAPYLPKAIDMTHKTSWEKFFSIFRCQTYWLLATRGSWRVLWSLWQEGRYEAAKTDRVVRVVPERRRVLSLAYEWIRPRSKWTVRP